MAEINTPLQKPKPGVPCAKRLSTKVDLTPMVDLGFLLITFFILTTTWSRPSIMPLNLPANGDSLNISNAAALTLIAAANDKIFYYEGELNEALKNAKFGVCNYSAKNGIEEIIEEKQVAMDKYYQGGRKELTVLIKATSGAGYGNMVSLLDEKTIEQVKRYSLIDLTIDEKKLLQEKKFFN